MFLIVIRLRVLTLFFKNRFKISLLYPNLFQARKSHCVLLNIQDLEVERSRTELLHSLTFSFMPHVKRHKLCATRPSVGLQLQMILTSLGLSELACSCGAEHCYRSGLCYMGKWGLNSQIAYVLLMKTFCVTHASALLVFFWNWVKAWLCYTWGRMLQFHFWWFRIDAGPVPVKSSHSVQCSNRSIHISTSDFLVSD